MKNVLIVILIIVGLTFATFNAAAYYLDTEPAPTMVCAGDTPAWIPHGSEVVFIDCQHAQKLGGPQ